MLLTKSSPWLRCRPSTNRIRRYLLATSARHRPLPRFLGPSPFLEEPWARSAAAAQHRRLAADITLHQVLRANPTCMRVVCSDIMYCSIWWSAIVTRPVTQEPASAAARARGCKRMSTTAERLPGTQAKKTRRQIVQPPFSLVPDGTPSM